MATLSLVVSVRRSPVSWSGLRGPGGSASPAQSWWPGVQGRGPEAQPWAAAVPSGCRAVRHQRVFGFLEAAVTRSRSDWESSNPNPAASPGPAPGPRATSHPRPHRQGRRARPPRQAAGQSLRAPRRLAHNRGTVLRARTTCHLEGRSENFYEQSIGFHYMYSIFTNTFSISLSLTGSILFSSCGRVIAVATAAGVNSLILVTMTGSA